MSESKSRETRYERLRPRQIVEQRQAFPVAYLPLGTLEWHGEHNPVGLDGLKAHALLIRCAEAFGGLVFPPLYYGEQRETQLRELNLPEPISERMGFPAENIAPGYMYQTISEQNTNYHHLLLHILYEIKSLGFKVVVICCGHYPLLAHANAAVSIFNITPRPHTTTAWATNAFELVRGQFTPCGDHAGKWETSLLMYLDPGMQDLSTLPKDPDAEILGVSQNRPQESNVELGRAAVEAIMAAIGAKAKELLAQFK